MEPFTDLGTYWLPGEESNPRTAQLSFGYGSQGITLAMLGSFEDLGVFLGSIQSHPGYPIIFGLMSDGDPVTLVGSSVGRTSLKAGAFQVLTVDLQPIYIFRGAHLPDGIETGFSGFQIHFDHMEEWAGQSLLTLIPDAKHAEFGLVEPEVVSASVYGGHLSVEYSDSRRIGNSQALFERRAFFGYECSEPKLLQELTRSISVPLQYFLTFALGASTYPSYLGLKIDGYGRQIGDTFVPTLIGVAYRGWHAPVEDDPPAQMRLPLSSVRDRFAEIMTSWNGLYLEQERAMVLLFAISLGLDLYMDSRFLFAIQAVEIYHRKRSPEGVLSKNEHRELVKRIVSGVQGTSERKWLREKLAYSNEPTLRERLQRMQEHAGVHSKFCLRDDFPKMSADTRNYLTHFNPRLKNKAAEGEDLFALGLEVRALLELCLLRDLGFTSEEALSVSARTSVFQYLLDRRGHLAPVFTVTTTAASTDPNPEDPAEVKKD